MLTTQQYIHLYGEIDVCDVELLRSYAKELAAKVGALGGVPPFPSEFFASLKDEAKRLIDDPRDEDLTPEEFCGLPVIEACVHGACRCARNAEAERLRGAAEGLHATVVVGGQTVSGRFECENE